MLQEMDSNLISNDNFIHEQNGKLVEKDKIIQNNKAEIERLEKRTKMQEHKVTGKNIQTSWGFLVCSYVAQFLKCPMCLFQIDILQKTTKIYEDDKRSLQHELETREQRLHRELSEKRRMEQRMHGVVSDTQFKWEKECVSYYNTDVDKLGNLCNIAC